MKLSRVNSLRFVGLLFLVVSSAAAAQPSYPLSRPILFVHGWCSSGSEWDGTLVAGGVAAHLRAENPTLYPDTHLQEVYYDRNEPVEELRTKFRSDGRPLANVAFFYPPRFFAITFYDAEHRSFDPTSVADVSIVNKAAELAGVVRAIVRLTRISDVLVVAHSMGGLVTRAYMENLVASAPCGPSYSCLAASLRDPEFDRYAGDIAGLVTIDTPHGGAGTAFLAQIVDSRIICASAATMNRQELIPGGAFVSALNYVGSHPFLVAAPLPAGVAIQSIESYRADHPFTASDGLTYYWDDIVDSQEQAIRQALRSHLTDWLIDSGNPFTDSLLPPPCQQSGPVKGPPFLHSLACVGNQASTESLVLNFLRPRLSGRATACTGFTVSPSSATVSAAAGSRQVAVSGTPAGCQGGSWMASGNGDWLRVSPQSGAAEESVTVSWTANSGSSSRTSAATIGGRTFTVIQAGTSVAAPAAPYLLGPGSSVSPGTTTASVSPTFFWQAVPSTDLYELEVADAGGTVANVTVPATLTSTIPTILADNHAYKWRMRSHGVGGWGSWTGYFYFSTYTGPSADFDLRADPSSGAVAQGGVATYTLVTSRVSGSPQAVSLVVGSLPPGVSAALSPAVVQTDGVSTLTLTVSPTAAPGGYAVVVTGTGSTGLARTVTVGLTINPGPGTGQPAICLSPTSLSFPEQMAGTASSFQTVTLRNCGSGPLHIASYGASAEFFIGPGSFAAPLDLVVGGATSFQVGFAPLGSGTSTGDVKIFSNAVSSPAVLPLSGTGTPAPITTGTVEIRATLNGQPYTGYVATTLTGPGGTVNFGTVPLVRPGQGQGDYTVALQTAGGVFTLSSITPSATQTLTAGTTVTFTLNFTATNQMSFRCPTSTMTGMTVPAIVSRGTSGSIPLTVSGQGGVQTATLSVTGLPGGVAATLTPSAVTIPAPSGSVNATMNLTVGPETPPGIYFFTVAATNQDGLVLRLGGPLIVPEDVTAEAESVSSAEGQADALAGWASMSADGRLVAFWSPASNLVSGDTNGTSDVFVRDRQAGTTSRVSMANDGAQANDWSGQPSISSSGRFVAFRSLARNLTTDPPGTAGNVYLRDLVANRTIRVSSAPDGAAANGECFVPSVSGDGRFVVYTSLASNLIPGVSGSQVYLYDALLGRTTLVSKAVDGTPGDLGSAFGTISADGRFVAFVSAATNLVPGATVAGKQVLVLDRETGLLECVSGAPGDMPANGGIVTYNWDERGPSLSADGRYVAFASAATNLVEGFVDDNFDGDVYVRDRVTGKTSAASVTNNDVVLGGHWQSISADGRYIAFLVRWTPLIQTVAVRDRLQDRTIAFTESVSRQLITAGSGPEMTDFVAISPSGRRVTISSKLSNLVAGDTNGQQDLYGFGPSGGGAVWLQSITVAPGAVAGGASATGTVTLNAPAPAGGTTALVSSTLPEVAVPATITVPQGDTSASFALSTLKVSTPVTATLLASAGGGSAWASMTIGVAVPSRIDAVAGDGQKSAPGGTLTLPFSARVVDGNGNPSVGAIVRFSAPDAGPSGTFVGGTTTVLAVSDQTGIATTPAFTTNSAAGRFALTASTAGVGVPAAFGVNSGAYLFHPLVPCRILDTRIPIVPGGEAPILLAGEARLVAASGICGVPATARALSVNQTVTEPTSSGEICVYRGDITPPPGTSNLSFSPGRTRAVNGIVELARDGSGNLYVYNRSSGTAHFIIDVNGYFE